jgi:hypothetical protein
VVRSGLQLERVGAHRPGRATEFTLDRSTAMAPEMITEAIKDLEFYLIELGERNPLCSAKSVVLKNSYYRRINNLRLRSQAR